MFVDTSTFEKDGVKYCRYCGEKANKETSWHSHYPLYDYYNCNCDDAKKEIELQKKKKYD